ncbi:pyridoxal 5'-phosphate synthase glutaminase subunit PdxT [Dermacoccus nishinomiyaensis]|uniref:pyridoxal 5'-phosphate synthase glutaminase subunit PdxT n=1 Tax=Dermacoccus nishinomiyaensis TaxID=1274 RepID=UPI0011A92890|nr:pyridoxal 5'-phosphate synthase glutaminase subunit PdxT [Dermacoccus nishinomiyaensis]
MESTPRTVIGVLAVQGDVVEHVRMLEDVGAHAVRVRRAADLANVDALVIPGGESTVMMRLIAQGDLLEPLRERIAAGMPAYGSCAGMILLADRILDGAAGQQTLGGLDVTARRNAFGRQVASFEADVTVDGVDGGPVRAVFIRAPWVEEVGAGVEVLSSVALPTGGEAVVAVRQGNLLATSFHPEVTDDARVHALFVRMVEHARG